MQIIGGIYKGRKLLTPKGRITRPTQGRLREALFNVCQNQIENASFLDLFGGSGAVGLEALSRGARHVTFVEMDVSAVRCILANIKMLGLSHSVKVVSTNVIHFLKKIPPTYSHYEIVFADPPYALFQETECLTNFFERIASDHILSEGGSFFIEGLTKVPPSCVKTLQHMKRYKGGKSSFDHYKKFSNPFP